MHSLRIRSFALASVIALAGAATVACGGESAGASPDDQAEGALENAPKVGHSPVTLPNGYLVSALDVVGGKIWAGLNNDYGYVVSVDPARMRIVDDLGPRSSVHLPANEGVTHDGRNVVFLAYDSDGEERGKQFSVRLTWFNPSSKKIEKSVRIFLDKNISDSRSSFVDRPNLAVAIDGGKVYLSVAHDRVNKIAIFAVPSAETTTLNEDGKLFDDGVKLPEFAKGLAIDGGNAYVAVPKDREDGYLVKIDLSSGTQKKIGEKLGYPVTVRVADSKLVVADHNGRILTLDKSTARLEKEEDMPDFVDDMNVEGGFIYAATRSGFVVSKLAR